MGNKICAISKKEYPENQMISGGNIMFAIRETIQKEHPEFTSDSWIEQSILHEYRRKYLESLVSDE